MSAVYDGNDLTGLVRVPDRDTLNQRDDGAWVATTFFRCKWSRVFSLMPRRYVTAHPDFNALICDGTSATKEKPGVALIQATYIGLPDGSSTQSTDEGTNSSVVELVQASSQEPLESHPNFSIFAGTADTPADGANFDEDGFFLGFTQTSDGANHELMGADSYLSPSVTLRRSYITKTRPQSVSGVGAVDENPPGISGAGSREFLKTHVGWRRAGGVWQVEEEWLRAKQGGEWSELLYD